MFAVGCIAVGAPSLDLGPANKCLPEASGDANLHELVFAYLEG